MKNKIILVSFMGLAISLFTSYYINTIFKQSLMESEQRKLLATVHSSSSHLLSYFKTLENAVITIGSSNTVLKALEEFEDVFYKIETEIKLSNKEKKSLENYYEKKFMNQREEKQQKNSEYYLPKTSSGVIAQYAYISENPFDIGHKEKLLFSMDHPISYNKVHKKYHPLFLREQKGYGFYDIFIIDQKGTVVYSVDKEFDFGTNLNNGVYASSNLAKSYHKVMNLAKPQVVFQDFDSYMPSNNKAAAFLSYPIYKNKLIIGAFIIQVPVSKINEIMNFNNKRIEFGLGESGEVYLVGENKLMRSDSRFISTSTIPEVQKSQTTIGIVKVDTESIKDALKGNSGIKIIKDYRGIDVLSAYLPINIFEHKWVILAEIDKEEIINLQKTNTIMLFILTIGVIGFLIFGFIFIIYTYIIKPLQLNNIILGDDILQLDQKVLVSQLLLNEYKKAVDASSIVSKTNIQGKITYVNDEFCHISGYEGNELIGHSHNIIRHADTPSSLFKDLWKTIKSKKIWKGIIKNQKKDGSVYYVNSTIVPMLDKDDNITEFMSIRSDVTELINKEKLLLKQTTDIPTGLPNRIKLMEVIEDNNENLKLAIIQIEGIHSINDFYGIKYGEHLIIEVSKSIQNIIEKTDSVLYRIATNKFALLHIKEIPFNDFLNICHKVNKYFIQYSCQLDNDNFDVNITMGIAKNKTNIYTNAERALHNACETNQDIICYDVSSDIQNNFEQNRKWVTKIKNAIHNNKIVVFTQPIISLNGSKEEKYECLMRMVDDDGSIISPFYFLEIAKSARLYTALTKIMIEKSFKYFSDKNASFSINLTIDDIMNKDLLSYLREEMKRYNIAHKLVIEIVESEGIENFTDVTNFIEEMKLYGCSISIDDFGTGYSNFEYLMKLDAEYIKIDGSLIKHIDHDKSAQLVVGLIVDFAKKLNRKTIAEYVHSEAVLKKVKEMKIDYSQGYFTGEPSSIEPLN